VIFQNGMNNRSSALAAAGLPRNLIKLFAGRNAEANVVLVGTIRDERQSLLVKEAYAWSLRNAWIFYCCIAGCALLSSVFMVRSTLSDVHVETRTGLRKREDRSMEGEAIEMH